MLCKIFTLVPAGQSQVRSSGRSSVPSRTTHRLLVALLRRPETLCPEFRNRVQVQYEYKCTYDVSRRRYTDTGTGLSYESSTRRLPHFGRSFSLSHKNSVCNIHEARHRSQCCCLCNQESQGRVFIFASTCLSGIC